MELIEDKDLDDTSFMFVHQTGKNSQIIYCTTILAVLLGLAFLPFIYTTVSVKGTGSIQSNIEKVELMAPVSGRIASINLKDNQKVTKETTLLSIDPSVPVQQNIEIKDQTKRLRNQLKDALNAMGAVANNISQPQLYTGLYSASWQQYTEQIHSANNLVSQASRIFERYEVLYSKKAVTQSEFEQYKFNYDQAVSDLSMVNKKYTTQWQTEANQYRNELHDLQNKNIQFTEEQKLYTLRSPVSGNLQNLTGLQRGSFISINQKIGEISPDSAVMAFCYLKPSDIGLIKRGQYVRFQIDAFNYNQWGFLKGTVSDISADIIIINQQPFFKIKCALDSDFLTLKNGYKGQIKKGMTFSARFTITKRSMYQLLYDKMDDWLNPSV